MTLCSTCNEKYLGDYCDCDEHFEEIQSKAILKILNRYYVSVFTSKNSYIDLGKNIDEIINEYLDFKKTYQYKNHIKNNKKLLKEFKKGIEAGSFSAIFRFDIIFDPYEEGKYEGDYIMYDGYDSQLELVEDTLFTNYINDYWESLKSIFQYIKNY